MNAAGELSPLMRAQLATPQFFAGGAMKLSPAMRDMLLEEFGAEAGEYVIDPSVGSKTLTLRALSWRGLILKDLRFGKGRRWTLTPLGAQVRASLVPPPESPAK